MNIEPTHPAGSPESRILAAMSRAAFWDGYGPENLTEFMQAYCKERARHWRHTIKHIECEPPPKPKTGMSAFDPLIDGAPES